MTTKIPFTNSTNYWRERYLQNGNSGKGSYGKSAEFKASTINSFVEKYNIKTVIEFGCGDGNQLKYSNYENYLGIDVSEEAITLCKKIFSRDKNKKFITLDEHNNQRADLVLSLDVIYHLIEDETYYSYMKNIVDACNKYLIVFSSNRNELTDTAHVKHRKFTEDLPSNIKLINYIKNPFFDKKNYNIYFADFYFFEKVKL